MRRKNVSLLFAAHIIHICTIANRDPVVSTDREELMLQRFRGSSIIDARVGGKPANTSYGYTHVFFYIFKPLYILLTQNQTYETHLILYFAANISISWYPS